MAKFSIDASELTAFAGQLEALERPLLTQERQVLSKGALNVKNGMAAEARASYQGHLKHLAGTITYDINMVGGGVLEAEIGPDKTRKQGPLAVFAYFGSRNNAPRLDLESPLRKEAPNFHRWAAKVLGEAIEQAAGR